MSGAALGVEGLAAAYGESRVIEDIGFELVPGSATALIGRNGVGKSTLLGTLMGNRRRVAGAIRLDGLEIGHLPPHARAHAGIALVPQGRHIFPHLSVTENLETGLAARPPGRRPKSLPDLPFELFPKLAQLRGRKGGLLSGGEQQQLAIGRALVGAPSLLLLDEPSEGIQPNVVDEIEAALARIRAELGMTLLVVEQNLDFVWRVADRYLAMDGGRMVAEGKTAGQTAAEVSHLVHI